MITKTLNMDQIATMAPSVMTTQPFSEVSDKYTHIPTFEVINLLEKEGWEPVFATELRVRNQERNGFQRHLLRFRHKELVVGDEAVETVLLNSHDRTSSYQFMMGVFRFVCANGLIIGDSFDKIAIQHKNCHKDDIIEASYKIIKEAPKVTNEIQEMKSIQLIEPEKNVFAKSVMSLMFNMDYRLIDEKAPVKPHQLLQNHRYEDKGDDLWTTLNVIQENVIRGGMRGVNPETKKKCNNKGC